MDSPYMRTTLNVFAELSPCARHAVHLSVGFSREDNGKRYTLLCLWRAKMALLAELALTEDERLELIERLVEAAPRPCRVEDDEEQDDEPNGEES